MSERIWKPGELVVERHVFRGEVRFGAPMWLVADDGQRVGNGTPAGSAPGSGLRNEMSRVQFDSRRPNGVGPVGICAKSCCPRPQAGRAKMAMAASIPARAHMAAITYTR